MREFETPTNGRLAGCSVPLREGAGTAKMDPICIIDDDEAVRDSLAVLLDACGYAVVCFDSALAFLDAADIADFLCLLVDVHMPGMNGLELMELLRGRGIGTPAIMITGAADAALRAGAQRLASLTFMEKPVDGERLLDAIERISA